MTLQVGGFVMTGLNLRIKPSDNLKRVVFLVVFGFLVIAGSMASATNVGFETIQVPNGTEPPLSGGVWYPTAAPATQHGLGSFTQNVAVGAPISGHDLALVVLSHGGGSSYEAHYDTALALAHAGFVAAAIDHAGDTYNDQSQVLRLWRRPAQLRRLVSYMLEQWPRHGKLNAAHVGAFGFSNGGFTVLVAAGGVPDLDSTVPYCQAHPDHDLCRALTQAGVDPHLGADVPAGAWISDPRIKAVVVAAPAFGFAFSPDGLKPDGPKPEGLMNLLVPVQLWRAAKDRHQPDAWYDEAVRLALPQPPEYHLVAGASHYGFLPPCSPRVANRAPLICTDPPGFNRAAFHRAFDAQVVRFFQRTLHRG
jgi:predicted dienelactone hydrolase